MTPSTPQRANRSPHSHSHSFSYSHVRSPSPATPYTPLSLRSFASSNPSPALTTPASIRNLPAGLKHLHFSSPQVAKSYTSSPNVSRDQSLADLARNWRSCASKNGIKVATCDASQFVDDDVTDMSFGDVHDSSFVTAEEALLPPPFLSNNRRRALSTSQAPASLAMNESQQMIPTSPLTYNNSSTLKSTITATPPPNRNLARQLKLRGSLTDPAHTRRREAFGVVSNTPQQMASSTNLDLSLDLFDIDENDVEHDYDYDYQLEIETSRTHEHLLPRHDDTQSQYQQDYVTYHLRNNAPPPAPIMPVYGQPNFADPFNAAGGVGTGTGLNNSIAQSVEQHFQQYRSQYPFTRQLLPYQEHSLPTIGVPRTNANLEPGHLSMPLPVTQSKSSTQGSYHVPMKTPVPEPPSNPVSCSVCSRHNPPRLAILVPCNHPLCSACLTSALNIVGEKDMECAVCKNSVEDFKLISGSGPVKKKSKTDRRSFGSVESNGDQRSGCDDEQICRGKGFMDPLFSSPGSAVSTGFTGGLESAFEFGGQAFFTNDDVRASTPPPATLRRPLDHDHSPRRQSLLKDHVVLRIDNVPWDITPPSISAWLQQPVERVHVLLDRKGKTMSHAFVEVQSEEIAAAILRGETSPSSRVRGDMSSRVGAGRGRGSVLGKGRRARGVTVTRSSQEELMAALFPSWRGAFDGSHPSLAGLNNDRVIGALEYGLMTDAEVSALLYLIQSPDAHFLKVPSLPFHSLISVLSKFPADVDSRVFWSTGLRDILYDVTYSAAQVLLGRIMQEKEGLRDNSASLESSAVLLEEVVRTATSCQAFTPQQMSKISEALEAQPPSSMSDCNSLSSYNSDADIEDEDGEAESGYRTPSSLAIASNSAATRNDEHPASPLSDHEQLAAVQSVDQIDDLAREFGVEADLVQALAKRLSSSGLR
ncbi:uncharacterized protein BT62DRAFT_1075568 [Guyanagaster necrorhizus]|uniref:RING-type domain-containing protein n=1 Tax=Guyanagaster necrorhizus TaxID=856835 RepID=A0A9P8AUE0_9AGAR|nr:uncharacterized protein BT62DRAFT_1075568 [Guyanagaster necrorhizus MCA 3950]KAG7446812.1 hypothetical protein BT62DRAFT_1075568 [Guyanagaster necrorhizus MCA 3950]